LSEEQFWHWGEAYWFHPSLRHANNTVQLVIGWQKSIAIWCLYFSTGYLTQLYGYSLAISGIHNGYQTFFLRKLVYFPDISAQTIVVEPVAQYKLVRDGKPEIINLDVIHSGFRLVQEGGNGQ